MKTHQPVQKPKGKKILIQEVEEDCDSSNRGTKAEHTSEFMWTANQYLYPGFTGTETMNEPVTVNPSSI